MGLLDDAIREHLELKKRSGASEDEIKRLEAEALTDPRPQASGAAEKPQVGGEDVSEAGDAGPADPLAEPAAPVLADEADWLEDPDEVPAAESLAAPALDPEPVREPPAPRREPPPVPMQRERERPAATSQETHEFTPEDIFADDEHVEPDDEPAEDVLEETPEFLQETPEHDRLWFEQKPPRDFDFGG